MAEAMNTNKIIDLDLSVTSKQKFRFNGDDSRIVEVDTSDLNITARFKSAYEKLIAAAEKASKLTEGINLNDDSNENTLTSIETVADRLAEIDAEMRELIDYLFDAPVSAAAAPSGSMYDLFDGDFRFNHIIDLMFTQYADRISTEAQKMKAQVSKHTAKYSKGKNK